MPNYRFRKFRIRFLVLFISLLTPITLIADVDFNALQQNKIDLSALKIIKSDYFSYIKDFIHTKPAGLGTYGQIILNNCDYQIAGKKISSLRSLDGKEIRYLSNPSCNQSVIKNVLISNYKYSEKERSNYDDRKCIRTIEKSLPPLFEYYAIRYELKPGGDCTQCELKERNKLQKIVKTREMVTRACKDEHVTTFLKEMEKTIESAYLSE